MADLNKLIETATDGTLTSDNWQYIMEVTDAISNYDPEQSTKEAISIITKRLASKDANVLLRTCLLVLAIAENCGSRMKQEIATKQFCLVLLGKLSDKKVHRTVKESVASLISLLNDLFKSDPSLKPMADAYHKVQKSYSQYLPRLVVPDKPPKKAKSQQDKLKEDEELQEAMRLSLEEHNREINMRKNLVDKKTFSEQAQLDKARSGDLPPLPVTTYTEGDNTKMQNNSPLVDEEAAPSIANISKVRALYDLISYEPDELSFRKGDIITVIESAYNDWWRGSLPNGKVGIFPLNYVVPVVPKSTKELAQETEAENKILYGDTMKKVDRLLALLSNPDVNQVDEEEVTRLYNDLIPLRPALLKSIEKYNERKDELKNLTITGNQNIKIYNQMVEELIKPRMSAYTGASQGNYAFNSSPYPVNNQSSYAYPLNAQPTSAGFGNAPFSGGPGNQPMAQSNTGYLEGGQGNYQFLNVNKFPDVNNMQ